MYTVLPEGKEDSDVNIQCLRGSLGHIRLELCGFHVCYKETVPVSQTNRK